MKARTICVAGVLVLATVGITSCATDARDSGAPSVANALATARERGLEWEVSILEDGEISSNDYEQAYDRYMECQRDLDYVFDKPKYLDPVEGQLWRALSIYRGPGEPPLEAMADCDGRLFLIEDVYVLTTPKVMDPQLLARFRQCLDEHSVAYEGNEVNFNDFTAELSDDDYLNEDSPHVDCLLESAFELYPDLVGVGYGR